MSKDVTYRAVANASTVMVDITHLVTITVTHVDVVRAAHVRLTHERAVGPRHVVEAEVARRFQTAMTFRVCEGAVAGGWSWGEEDEEEENEGGCS